MNEETKESQLRAVRNGIEELCKAQRTIAEAGAQLAKETENLCNVWRRLASAKDR